MGEAEEFDFSEKKIRRVAAIGAKEREVVSRKNYLELVFAYLSRISEPKKIGRDELVESRVFDLGVNITRDENEEYRISFWREVAPDNYLVYQGNPEGLEMALSLTPEFSFGKFLPLDERNVQIFDNVIFSLYSIIDQIALRELTESGIVRRTLGIEQAGLAILEDLLSSDKASSVGEQIKTFLEMREKDELPKGYFRENWGVAPNLGNVVCHETYGVPLHGKSEDIIEHFKIKALEPLGIELLLESESLPDVELLRTIGQGLIEKYNIQEL